MTQVAAVTTWSSGQILTAAALDGEFSQGYNNWNNHDNGTSTMTSPKATTIGVGDGAVGGPSIYLNTSTTTGIYKASTGLGIAISGANVMTILSSGISVLGSNTNDSASSGYIGEYISSAVAVASAVSSTGSTQYVDVTSIILTAGDWDVSALVGFTLNSATVTACIGGIGTVTGNSSTGVVPGDTASYTLPPTSAVDTSVAIPSSRKSISGTTTFYLKFSFTHSAGTPKAYGRISARRMR